MSELAVFSFEKFSVRTLGTAETPLFVAIDVAAALGYQRARDAVSQHCDPDDIIKAEIETKGGRQTVNCVNESGLYALIFGSKLESAKRFKRWVTNEVLPAIRKQGRYECPAQAQLPAPTLTEQQSYQILSEVAKRCKRNGVHYQTVYRALKARYQVTKYTHIPRDKFEDALEFIRTMPLNVPEGIPQTHPEPVPESRPKIVVSPTFCENMRNFIFIWNYLHRDHLIRFLKLLKDLRSPYAEGLSDAIHSLNMDIIELSLADIGFPVKELDCYKYWAIKHATK